MQERRCAGGIPIQKNEVVVWGLKKRKHPKGKRNGGVKTVENDHAQT